MSLKVTDIVNVSEKLLTDINQQMKVLDDLTLMYTPETSLFELEELKIRFNAELQYMGGLYAKIKAYKGKNHTFLEEEINKIKAETYAFLFAKKMNSSQAEKLVYAEPYYVERIELAKKIIRTFSHIEEMYKRYDYTLTCIVQSISINGKEFNHSKTS
jgi:hypothetical protein